MKRRVLAVAIGAMAVLASSPAAVQAASYDHKDPYKSGCGSTARAVRTAKIVSRVNGEVGTIKLMWSSRCQTNWTEVKTGTSMTGTVKVYTADGRTDSFRFKKGNGGRHWGNMLKARGICAWGSVSVQWNGGRGGQNAQGTTSKACG